MLSGKPRTDGAGPEAIGNVVFCSGWDEISVVLWALVKGKGQLYRMPKSNQAFNHARQTEWMWIPEVETEHYLLDVHSGHVRVGTACI